MLVVGGVGNLDGLAGLADSVNTEEFLCLWFLGFGCSSSNPEERSIQKATVPGADQFALH